MRTRARPRWTGPVAGAVGAAVAVLVGVGCTGGDADEPAATAGTTTDQVVTASAGPTRLRVMVFNIEYGGTVVDFDQVVEAVRAAEPDVVVLCEAQGNVERLARAVGWEHSSRSSSVISRLPVLDPPDGRDYVYVETEPGRVVAVANVHLPSSPYGPNELRAGTTRSEVLALERRLRVPAIRPVARDMGAVAETGVPTFVGGDFNSPAATDWTRSTVGARPQLDFAMPWPAPAEMADAGFTDSYRAVHPDPVTHPGLTWPAERPRSPDSWNPRRSALADRIDQLWSAGPARPLSSGVVGEPGAADVPVQPWGSDHRAVVTTFAVRPAPTPVLVSPDESVVPVGTPVELTVHRSGAEDERLVLARADGSGTTEMMLPEGSDSTSSLETDDLAPGRYDVTLVDEDGEALASAPVWLAAEDQRPALRTTEVRYRQGDPVRLCWRWAPGYRHDWIAVSRYGQGTGGYLHYVYTDGTVAGCVRVDARADGRANRSWPLRPGRYSAYLALDDGYEKLAQTSFRVVAR